MVKGSWFLPWFLKYLFFQYVIKPELDHGIMHIHHILLRAHQHLELGYTRSHRGHPRIFLPLNTHGIESTGYTFFGPTRFFYCKSTTKTKILAAP